MQPIKNISRWLFPGSIDGFLLLTIVVSFLTCMIPWQIVLNGELPRPSRTSILMCSIACGAALGLLVSLDFFFVFGRGPLEVRFIPSLLISSAILLAPSIAFCLALKRYNWAFNTEIFKPDLVTYAVLCQRWVVLSGLGLMSLMFRACGVRDDGHGEEASIALREIFVVILFCAAAIVSARYVLTSFPQDFLGYWRASYQQLEIKIGSHVTLLKWAAVLELAAFAFYLLIPKFITGALAFLIPKVRKYGFLLGTIWFCGWAAFFAWRTQTSAAFDLKVVGELHVGLAIILGVMAFFRSYWRKSANEIAGTSTGRCRGLNPFGALACLLACAGWWGAAHRYDLATIIAVDDDRQFGIARTVSRLSEYDGGYPSRYVNGYGFQGKQILWGSLFYENAAISFGGDTYQENLSRNLRIEFSSVGELPPDVFHAIRDAHPPFDSVYLEVYDATTLRSLAETGAVKKLDLTFHYVDFDLLDEVLANVEVETLNVRIDSEVTLDDNALGRLSRWGDSIAELKLLHKFKLTANNIDFLRRLPLKSLSCSYDDPGVADFSDFRVVSLDLIGSTVDATVLASVPPGTRVGLENTSVDAKAIEPLCSRTDLLYLLNTQIDAEAVRRLTSSRIREIIIENPEIPIDLEAAYGFAECMDKSLHILASNINKTISTKFNYRTDSATMVVPYSENEDYEEDDPLLRELCETGNLDAAVTNMAHEVGRDEAGNLTELNLQWYSFSPEARSQIYKLHSLKRLRIDGKALTKDIAKLEQLESLEIPSDWVPDSVLRQIGELTKLKRLQLPPFPFCSSYENPRKRFPEDDPFSRRQTPYRRGRAI